MHMVNISHYDRVLYTEGEPNTKYYQYQNSPTKLTIYK
jgi:hypothetical protein